MIAQVKSQRSHIVLSNAAKQCKMMFISVRKQEGFKTWWKLKQTSKHTWVHHTVTRVVEDIKNVEYI